MSEQRDERGVTVSYTRHTAGGGRRAVPFHSLPFPSISIPFHSIPFHSIPFHSRPSQYITVLSLPYIASHGRGVPGRRARRRRSARGASASSSAASTSKPRSVRVLAPRTVMQRSASARDGRATTRYNCARAQQRARRAMYARTRSSSHLVSFNRRRKNVIPLRIV